MKALPGELHESRNQVYKRLAQVIQRDSLPEGEASRVCYPDRDGNRKQLILDLKRVTKVGQLATYPCLSIRPCERLDIDMAYV